MAFKKYSNALITRPVTTLNSWVKTASHNKGVKASAFINLKDFPMDKFLFTQATIMGSVALDTNGFYIKKGSESLVNMNGDCWPNEVTALTYNTFVGAYNFLNHVQIPSESKGVVLDAAPRLVILKNGAKSLYVDILVATDLRHASLCKEIELGIMNTLSLGAIVEESRCSYCGHTSKTGSDLCKHLIYERRGVFTDECGDSRIIAEICGNKNDAGSNRFIEASWVSDPAFPGAVKRHKIAPSFFERPDGSVAIVDISPKDERSLLAGNAVANKTAKRAEEIIKAQRNYKDPYSGIL